MNKKQLGILVLALWLVIIFFLMILVQNVDIEVFFVLALIGLLVIMKLMEQKYIQPGYVLYFRYLIIVGIVIFCIIAVHKTLISTVK
jgi:hypothetical protein